MMMQPQPQLNRIQQMNNMMQNVRRDDGLSNLMALQQMRQMRQPQMMQQPPQTMTYMAQGGFPDLSGDGRITQKDILMARGVIEKNKGGLTSLPMIEAFKGFRSFKIPKPIRQIGRTISKGAQMIGGAAQDVVDGTLSGVSSALGGGKGTGDFLKTLALMAVTNMLIPGGGALMNMAKAYVVPSLATGGLNELTSDPLRQDKLLRAAAAGAMTYAGDKYQAYKAENTPEPTFSADAVKGTSSNMQYADKTGGIPSSYSSNYAQSNINNPNMFERGIDTAGGYIDKAGSIYDSSVNAVGDFLKTPIGPGGYDVAQLGKDAVTAYGTTEIKKEMDAAKQAYQDAQGLAAQIQAEAEGRQMTARQFAKAAIEDPVKYSYIYKYGDSPQSVQDILERMYQGTEDTQTAQYFEPATYTTESGRLPGELAAATGGGISSIINNARGQNNQFFQGQVPNTTRDNSDGMSDNETMLITDETGKKPKGIMKISEKEYVVSAPDMAILGNGDPNAGAQALDEFRQGLRKAAYGTKAHQPRLNPRTALQSLANKAFG
jgi:hypothetical protein